MAKQTLPTNFVDDILAPSMNKKRKFTITALGDGTYEIEDVTDYTQTGSDFGAGQINATNKAVNESCDKADVIDGLDDLIANQAGNKIAGAKSINELYKKYLFEKKYEQSSFPIQSFYYVEDYDLRKSGNRVDFNVSLSLQSGAQFDPNTLYSIGPSPMPSELRPQKVYFLNGYGCDENWGNPTAISAFVDEEGYVRYCASVRKAYFKISGHWFTD